MSENPTYVFDAPPVPSLPVLGLTARFALRRIFCVGRNYGDHAREMGHDPDAEPPFFFTKPADALVQAGSDIPYPPQTDDLHHEAELVVAIGKTGRNVTREQALAMVFGYAAGNDLTRRDLQAAAKSARRPWDMSKGFDNSAVIGAIRPGSISDCPIRCHVDGELRQEARLSDMIWPVADVIAHLSQSVTLMAGDLIMTGTPAGVGAIRRGQTCIVTIGDLPPAQVRVN